MSLINIRGMTDGQQSSFLLAGFDACLMSSLEVLYENRTAGCLFVSSEDTEPGGGWPYDKIISSFLSVPPPSAEALARSIVDDFIESYCESGKGATLAALSPQSREGD